MHQPSLKDRFLSAQPQDAAKKILLLDCDDRRRGIRAEALLEAGAVVDVASETQMARTLWKEGSYDLVLVDLRGADGECEAFLLATQADCMRQKFGFFISQRPYITTSAAECRIAIRQELTAVTDDPKSASEPAPAPRETTGLAVATRKIRAARHVARAAANQRLLAEEMEQQRVRVERDSEALQLAKRMLGAS